MLSALIDAVTATGMAVRGAFHPAAADAVPSLADGRPAATVILIGLVGGSGWPVFTASPEAGDGGTDPLDRWTRRCLQEIAEPVGATVAYPFGGPPWLPFLRWAQRAEPGLHPSPLGIMIHPAWGLWHGYRGALLLAERLPLPEPEVRESPCMTCQDRPCLTACPAEAFGKPGIAYDIAACRDHLDSDAGQACREGGCLARRACPVGAGYRHSPAQAAFHMRAFRGLI